MVFAEKKCSITMCGGTTVFGGNAARYTARAVLNADKGVCRPCSTHQNAVGAPLDQRTAGGAAVCFPKKVSVTSVTTMAKTAAAKVI